MLSLTGACAGDIAFESPDFTTAGRIVRLVRIFKTDKYINAFGLLGDVLWDNRTLLVATSFYSLMARPRFLCCAPHAKLCAQSVLLGIAERMWSAHAARPAGTAGCCSALLRHRPYLHLQRDPPDRKVCAVRLLLQRTSARA